MISPRLLTNLAGLAGLAGLAFLSACAAPRKPEPAPLPPPRPVATAVPAQPPADWRDAALTVGDWRYVRMEQSITRGVPFPTKTVATFSSSPSDNLFELTCEPGTGQVWLGISGIRVPEDDTPPVTITTSSRALALSAPPRQGNWITVEISPRDPILDAMAFSRGRFMVAVPGMPTLYLPAWPEIGRVIEDCR